MKIKPDSAVQQSSFFPEHEHRCMGVHVSLLWATTHDAGKDGSAQLWRRGTMQAMERDSKQLHLQSWMWKTHN